MNRYLDLFRHKVVHITLLANCILLTACQQATIAILLEQAESFRSKGEYDSAIYYCDQAIKINKNSVKAYTIRANTDLDKGNYGQAVQDLTGAINLRQHDASIYYLRGVAHEATENYDLAIKDYSAAIELQPKIPAAYNSRGHAHHQKGQFEQAIKDYCRAIELYPEDAWFYYGRGVSFISTGSYDSAIGDFNQAVAIDPGYADAYNDRGVAYFYKGSLEQALLNFDKAIELDPAYPEPYNNRGLVHMKRGNYEQALREFSGCLEVDSLNPLALLNILPCLVRLNRFEEAALYYGKYRNHNIKGYLESEAWKFYQGYLAAATHYIKKGLYKKALEELQASEAAYNSSTESRTNVNVRTSNAYCDVLALEGYVLERLNRAAEAEAAYKTALETNPFQPDVKENLKKLSAPH